MKPTSTLLLLLCCIAQAHASRGQVTSELWGANGEHWTPTGRLPDFSFAGYHCGQDPLPRAPAVADVAQFGARGDGKTDCTQAFVDAIEATKSGAITIPPGRYILSSILWIRKPNIVLRGAGPDRTILHFVGELEDIRPNMGATTSGRPTSNYSWSGGFIWAVGDLRERPLTPVTSDASRGSSILTVRSTEHLHVGRWVQVVMRDDEDRTLLSHLYSGDPGNTKEITRAITPRMVCRIASMDGNQVTLERPLRFDVRQTWSPVLSTFDPTVREIGIEDLALEFPVKPYAGHFTERGMNGIAMSNVADSWVRNVRISNSDSGVYLSGIFCTIDGLILDSTRRDHRGTTGHHGISYGTDCLVQNFDFRTHFIHDITLGYLAAGNVTKNGKGVNLSLDHHKKAPHDNLFCNLNVGKGNEIWRCGGGSNLGKHCGARGTFWCITADEDIDWPPDPFGPDSMNLVGVRTRAASRKEPQGKWLEAIAPETLRPADLHAAQLARRLHGARTSD